MRPVAALLAASSLLLAAAHIAGCVAPDVPTGPLASCLTTLKGICLPTGECATGGGTVPTTASDCYADSGPTECCTGPTPKPSPTTCGDQGGVCVAPNDCAIGSGYLTVIDMACGGAGVACCVPYASCGEASVQCCGAGGNYGVQCDQGKLVCTQGVMVPAGECG